MMAQEETEAKTNGKGNSKPISLYPLKFREAVAALLATKPPVKKRRGKDEDKGKEASS